MIAAAAAVALAAAAGPAAEPLVRPNLGRATIERPAGPARRMVIVFSGPSALGAATSRLQNALAADGALVVAIDSEAYVAAQQKTRCAYPAGDLETLAQGEEKRIGMDAYRRPIVVGEGVGGAIAWASVAQAPEGTFLGGVLVEPALRPLRLRLCAGSGPAPRKLEGGSLPAETPRPKAGLEVLARAASAENAERFARAVAARFVPLEGDPERPVLDAIARIEAAAEPAVAGPASSLASATCPAVSDLPVVEVPAATSGDRLALLLTGDGGWVGIDKEIARAFAEEGVPTVGLDSLRYFWKRRTPEETARDVARILAHYRSAWKRPEVILVGYSRGADIVPFVAARLPPEERSALKLVAMLGPGTFAEFEVHAVDLFSSMKRKNALSTEDAVRATGGRTPMLCVHGDEEKDSLCPNLADLPWVKELALHGGHHFDGGYAKLARAILDAAE